MNNSCEYGYDASFITDVPDYLQCVVCHLVLREPIQIMQCGHRFCTPCFERIKGYSQCMSTELLCPIDRNKIELSKVFVDTGIARVIGDLLVRCPKHSSGCVWTGDLRDVEVHYEDCKISNLSQSKEKREDFTLVLEELSSKMSSFEVFNLKNEKEIALLKYTVHELKNKTKQKDKDIFSLNEKVTSLENELLVVKNSSNDLRKYQEKELENVSLRGELLDSKINSLQAQVTDIKKKIEVNAIHKTVSQDTEKLDELNTLNSNLENVSLKQPNETSPQNIHVDINEVKEEGKKSLLESVRTDVVKLQAHIVNIENILFCDSSKGSMNIVLKWKLQNYEYHLKHNEYVYSPRFYSQFQGYCFQLFVKWSGNNKETIGVYLTLRRGLVKCDFNKVLAPFNMPYKIEIMDTSGNRLEYNITLETIEKNRSRYFSISPDKHEVIGGYGYTFPLSKLNVQDMLLIRCVLTQPPVIS